MEHESCHGRSIKSNDLYKSIRKPSWYSNHLIAEVHVEKTVLSDHRSLSRYWSAIKASDHFLTGWNRQTTGHRRTAEPLSKEQTRSPCSYLFKINRETMGNTLPNPHKSYRQPSHIHVQPFGDSSCTLSIAKKQSLANLR